MPERTDKQETESATIDATVRSSISTTAISAPLQSVSTTASVALRRGGVAPRDHVFSGIVGRCFLRVCFWIEVFTGWKKKYQPVEWTFAQAKGRNLLAEKASGLKTTASGNGTLSVQSTVTAALSVAKRKTV